MARRNASWGGASCELRGAALLGAGQLGRALGNASLFHIATKTKRMRRDSWIWSVRSPLLRA